MTILSPQHMTISTNTVCHSQLIFGFIQTQHENQIGRSFSVFELYSTQCSHHGSFCLLSKSHLTFFQASCFTSIQYFWSYITHISSPFQPYQKSFAIQQLTSLHKLNPPTSCSDSHSSLTSYICTHPVTKICELPYSFHFIT